MREFEHAAFLIQQTMPRLAETVDALAVKRCELASERNRSPPTDLNVRDGG